MMTLGKVLYVDLTERKFEVVERFDLFDKYLGGSGVGSKLLLDECPQGVDPFAPENPVILSVGPLNCLYPCASKTVANFKSPITGSYGESHAGGRLSFALRMAGYGALVIKGFSERLVCLFVDDEGVTFRGAEPLKGLSSLEVERELRRLEGPGIESIVSIGPAGERMVFYASVNVDRYNYFGRLGLGAIFGAKNLKAIVIRGSGEVKAVNPDAHRKLFDKVYDEVLKTDKMSKYHYVGTPVNVLTLNAIKALPTRNFQQGWFEYAEEISGELIGEKYLERKVSCAGCPLGCLHVAKLKPAFAPGYEYEPIDIYYNYESIYALGSNLGIKSAPEVLRLIYKANMIGVDTMLVGNALGWLTEAYEKGLISDKETLGLKPRWGDTETYLKVLDNLLKTPNEFYALMAQGVNPMAEAYGGFDYATTIAGNGLAGYFTGYASIVGTAVAARHSHNSNAGYSIDQKALRKPLTPSQIVDELIKEEDWRFVQTSMVICLFSRGVYTPSLTVEALKTVGIERSEEELYRLGSEIFMNAYRFKFREGFSFETLKIPNRFFEVPTSNGVLSREVVNQMIMEYRRKRWG